MAEKYKKMGRKVYIDGGLLIMTPLFTSSKIVAGCVTQPEGTEHYTPKSIVEGTPCLIIDDDHPQSLFDEFYVRDFVSSGAVGTPYYVQNYDGIYEQALGQLTEIKRLIESGFEKNTSSRLLNKLCFVNILTILDSYISSCVVAAVAHDESTFMNYYIKNVESKRKAELSLLLIRKEYGNWEKEIIKEDILGKSFLNHKRIADSFKVLKWKVPNLNNPIIKDAIADRHILVHRNGKRMDGSSIDVTKERVSQLINVVESLLKEIHSTILSSERVE